MSYQLQYLRRLGEWLPMPEGRGVPQETRADVEKQKRMYKRAYKHLTGQESDLQLRIVRIT